MSGTIDWLVLTAANRRQAKAYASQIAARAERGALAKARGILVVPDACERRIGSGAATVLALVQLARQLAQRKRARSVTELFAGERVLMLHSGGDSRRLPMYAAEGKLFASVPARAAGARCATVFDVLLADLLALAPREGGEVLVGAGDAVLGIARDPVRFDGPGVIGVAQRAGVERAVRHGGDGLALVDTWNRAQGPRMDLVWWRNRGTRPAIGGAQVRRFVLGLWPIKYTDENKKQRIEPITDEWLAGLRLVAVERRETARILREVTVDPLTITTSDKPDLDDLRRMER